MAEDRNVLEQRAMALLQKGKMEDALQAYQAVLKIAPRDIRIRQKLADLSLQLGRKPEAMRYLREVALGHISEDQHRPAIVVLKQLYGLKPKDDEVTGLLGDCYKKTGFVQDAREWFEKTLEILDDSPKEALPWASKLVDVCPGEMPPKISYAELLNRAGKFDVAFGHWVRLGQEARRRGNAGDQALFNERALRIEEESLECLESAAEARIAMGQAKEALVHIQKAYGANPESDSVLLMLAQCFELLEQPANAKKVFLQLANVLADMNDPVRRREALERALICDKDDAELQGLVGAAVARAERAQLRLNDGEWSQPQSQEEAEAVVRASVLLRYGFADRAKDVLEGVDVALQALPSVQANLVEVYVSLDDLDAAQNLIKVMRESHEDNGGEVLDALNIRSAALRGDFDLAEEGEELPDVEESSSLEIEDDEEELVELEMDDGPDGESAEARGDRLASEGDVDGAITAYRSGLAEDPTNETLLMKIGELLNPAEPTEPVANLPIDSLESIDEDAEQSGGSGMPDFQSIFEGGGSGTTPSATPSVAAAPTPAQVLVEDEILSEARGRLLVGQYDQVAEVLGDRDELAAHVLMAEALMRQDDVSGAMRQLRDAMDEADEDDVAAADALWLLAGLQASSGKYKAAKKTLDKLVRKHDNHRSLEVAALRRGITHLSNG